MYHYFPSSVLDFAMDLHFTVQIPSPDVIFAKVITLVKNYLPLTRQQIDSTQETVFMYIVKICIYVIKYRPYCVISMMISSSSIK